MYNKNMSGNPKNKKDATELSQDKSYEEIVEDEKRRQLAVHAATLALWSSNETQELIIKSKRADLVAEMEARRDASVEEAKRVQESRAKQESNRPWGIKYLAQSRNQATIEAEVRQRLASDAERLAIQKNKSEEIPKLIESARELTLSIGDQAAQRLKEAGAKPDTEIYWGRNSARTSGFRSKKVHKTVEYPSTGKPQKNAWLIPIPGQVNSSARALLMEDGEILTAFGNFEAKGETKKGKVLEVNRIFIKPNVPPKKDKNKEQISHNHVYYKYMNNEPESDLGMAIVPVSKNKDHNGKHLPTTTHGANIILERETAMQEALMSLVLKSEA